MQTTEEYIHDMWNAQNDLKKEVIPVMQLASVQILLTKPTFNARGWFTLDMTFIHTVEKFLTKTHNDGTHNFF